MSATPTGRGADHRPGGDRRVGHLGVAEPAGRGRAARDRGDAAADWISYRVPDLTDGAVRARYAGRHVVIAGSGHSALTALVAFAELAEQDPATRVTLVAAPWRGRVRRSAAAGPTSCPRVARSVCAPRPRSRPGGSRVVTGFRTESVERERPADLVSDNGQRVSDVDEVVVLTGFRPDLSWLSELRLELDATLQAPVALAPLIDPNVHSCGTVYPHGVKELSHPEPNVYLAGMKSYGRAPTFLAMTGYEQVRSHRRRPRRGPRGRRAGRAGAAGDRRVRRRGRVRRARTGPGRRVLRRPAEAGDADPVGAADADEPVPRSRRAAGDASRTGRWRGARDPVRDPDHQLGRPLLRLPGAGRRHHRGDRLVDGGDHRGAVGQPARRRVGGHPGRSVARPARPARGDDRRVGARRARGRRWSPTAQNLVWFFVGWVLVGAAMGAVLYPPAFAALTRWYGPDPVRALTVLTLAGGLASTVFAPLTAALADAPGLAADLSRARRRSSR